LSKLPSSFAYAATRAASRVEVKDNNPSTASSRQELRINSAKFQEQKKIKQIIPQLALKFAYELAIPTALQFKISCDAVEFRTTCV
jgi:hypothetical protein